MGLHTDDCGGMDAFNAVLDRYEAALDRAVDHKADILATRERAERAEARFQENLKVLAVRNADFARLSRKLRIAKELLTPKLRDELDKRFDESPASDDEIPF